MAPSPPERQTAPAPADYAPRAAQTPPTNATSATPYTAAKSPKSIEDQGPPRGRDKPLLLRLGAWQLAAAKNRETPPGDQFLDYLESIRMPGCDEQHRQDAWSGVAARQLYRRNLNVPPNVQQRVFFAGQRTAGNYKTVPLQQRREALSHRILARGPHVILQIPNRPHRLRPSAHLHQPPCCPARSEPETNPPAATRAPRPPAPAIPCVNDRSETRAHSRAPPGSHAARTPPASRPKLALHQHQHLRLQRPQIRPHRPRKIQG